MESRLQIPDSDQEPLAAFLALPKATADAFILALSESPVSFRRQDLVKSVQGKTGLTNDESAAIVRVLLALFLVGQDLAIGTEELVEQVALAVDESDHPSLRIDAKQRAELKDRLHQALRQNSLGLTAKALSVAIEHKYLLHQARIVTDIRPVFTGTANDAPGAFVVSHVPRLNCHKDGGFEEFYVGMSSADLGRLAELVKRAQSKELTLRQAMKPCNVPVLSVEGDFSS
jgi:hypothetical protein